MRNLLIYLGLFFLTSLLVIDLFLHKGIFTAHDIEANVGRFGAFYLSLKEGNIFPNWAGYVANGYGSPVLMFSYSLPYYFQLPIKLIGFSLVDTAKIYIFLTYVLSAIFMLLFLKHHFASKAAFMGSLFYAFAPYRINDIYARGSLSEHTAFLLIPIVGIVVRRLFQRFSAVNILFAAIVIAGLILSHPFFIIITSFFFVIYIAVIAQNYSHPQVRGMIFQLIAAVIIAICLSAFSVFPLILENKYLHYNINPFSSAWQDQFVSLSKLVLPNWTFIDVTGKLEYQTWQMGLFHLLVAILSIPLLIWTSKKNRKLLVVGQLSFIASILFMTQLSYPIYVYEHINFFRHIQFPWRFAGLAVISLSFLAAGVFDTILNKISRAPVRWMIVGVSTTILLVLNLPYSKGHGYKDISDFYYFYELVHNTEGVATTPIWAAAPESYPRASFFPVTQDGNSQVKLTYIYRNGSNHSYIIDTQSPTTIVDQTFYFPNWQVLVNGKAIPIEFQNPDYRGLITFQLPEGVSRVEVIFYDTKLRLLAKIISSLSIVAVLCHLGMYAIRWLFKHIDTLNLQKLHK